MIDCRKLASVAPHNFIMNHQKVSTRISKDGLDRIKQQLSYLHNSELDGSYLKYKG